MAFGLHRQARMAAEASWGRGEESPTASQSEAVGRIGPEGKLNSKSRSDSAARRWKESRCWCFDIQEGLSARTGARRIDWLLLPFVPIPPPLAFVSVLMRVSQSRKGVSALESSHIQTASSRYLPIGPCVARYYNLGIQYSLEMCRFYGAERSGSLSTRVLAQGPSRS